MLEIVPSLRRLRAFDAAARLHSLSAAAQELRLTQPALTHSISQLEADLGARLFERGPDGAFPTPAGEIFHRRCARFFAQARVALGLACGRAPDDSAVDAQVAKLATAQARSLIAVWRAGSFRAAARALGIAEPSLQRPARDLEQIVGAPLYRRSAAGLVVTECGEGLARRLSLALGEIRSGREEIGAADARPGLRIGVLALTPRLFLARTVAALLADGARQRVEVVEGSYAQVARALDDGGLDLLFGALRAPPPFPDLLEEPLFEDPYAIVCRRDHPLTALRRVTPADLASYAWVHPTAGLPRRDVLDGLGAAWDLSPAVQVETSCLTTIHAILAGSDRLSILSHWHVENDAQLARVAHSPIPHPRREIGVTLRRSWMPTPFQAAFLARLRQEARVPAPA